MIRTKLHNGQFIETDDILYISPTGLDTNSGTTPEQALLTLSTVKAKLNTSRSMCIYFMPGNHFFTVAQWLILSTSDTFTLYFVSDPRLCQITINCGTLAAQQLWRGSGRAMPSMLIHLRIKFMITASTYGIVTNTYSGYQTSYIGLEIHNCYFTFTSSNAPTAQTLTWMYSNTPLSKTYNCIFSCDSTINIMQCYCNYRYELTDCAILAESTASSWLKASYGAFAAPGCYLKGTTALANAPLPTVDNTLTADYKGVVRNSQGELPIGVAYGAYAWQMASYVLMNNNVYYTIIDNALVEWNEGMASISDLTLVTKELCSSLSGDVYLVDTQAADTVLVKVNRLCSNNYVYATGDIGIATVETVNNVRVLYSQTPTGFLTMGVSNDSAETWYTFADGAFVPMANLEALVSEGMSPSVLEAITPEAWATFVGDSKTLRFAYGLNQTTVDDNVEVYAIMLRFKYQGVFDQVSTDDAYYSKATGMIEVKFNIAGSYVVNYHYEDIET